MEKGIELIQCIERLIGSFETSPPKGVADGVNPVIDELCDLYLNAEDGIRRSIRRIISDLKSVRAYLQFNYIRDYTCPRVREEKDEKWIKRALAAISIEDFIFDYRDSASSLELICKTAGECGIDILPLLTLIAQISNPEKNKLGLAPARDWFLQSAERCSQNRSKSSRQ